MKRIIIDCDNTFGVAGCDIDDGLAILYALGSDRCELLGVTTTFGNSTLDVTYPNTVAFMAQIGRPDIPVFRSHATDASHNEAAHFLVEQVARHPGEVAVLATGSLTNLHHASLLDPTFFEHTAELSLMGGITEPLIIGGRQLHELNFSCDGEAALHVLTCGSHIKIATGNHCLGALFPKAEFDRLGGEESPFLRWLHGESRYWFAREREVFGHDGIYKWDVYAAAALLDPHLFCKNITAISPDRESLRTGHLLGGGKPCAVDLPVVRDCDAYRSHVYRNYARFAQTADRRSLR